MLILKCPKCGNKQKYQPSTQILTGKKKGCVYCGKSFEARLHIVNKD